MSNVEPVRPKVLTNIGTNAGLHSSDDMDKSQVFLCPVHLPCLRNSSIQLLLVRLRRGRITALSERGMIAAWRPFHQLS